MASKVNGKGGESGVGSGTQKSPLEIAKEAAERTSRNPKDLHWLGLRMENFLRAYSTKIDTVSAVDVCDYLEGLMRKNQAEWQIKQSLDAIAILMRNGYQREDLAPWDLREAWGVRLNQRAGITVPDLTSQISKSQISDINATGANAAATATPNAPVTERLRRVLRVAHYAQKTEKAYTQWWERFEKHSGGVPKVNSGPQKRKRSWNIWQSSVTFQQPHRSKRSMRWSSSLGTSWGDRWGIWGTCFWPNPSGVCRVC